MEEVSQDDVEALNTYIDCLVDALQQAAFGPTGGEKLEDVDGREVLRSMMREMVLNPLQEGPTVQVHLQLLALDEQGGALPDENQFITLDVPVAMMEKILGRPLTPEELQPTPAPWEKKDTENV